MTLDGSDSKAVVEPVHSASTHLQDTQVIDQDRELYTPCDVSINLYLCPERLVSVLPADTYPRTDKPRPYEEGLSTEIEEEVPSVHPGTLVEDTFKGATHGA